MDFPEKEAEANHSLDRQPVEGFLGEGNHCTYLKAEERTVGKNLSVRIRSQRRLGVIG